MKENKMARLLVLVPNDDLDESRYARKARMTAELLQAEIVFIGLVNSGETDAPIRRKLVTLTGIAGSEASPADFRVQQSSTWLDALDEISSAEDFILSPKELEDRGDLKKAHRDMRSAFAGRTYLVSGMILPSDKERLDMVAKTVLNWAGILAILAVGFFVEAGFDQQMGGFLKTFAEVLVLFLEVGILWWWNSFVNRFNN